MIQATTLNKPTITKSTIPSVLTESLIETFSGLFGGAAGLGHLPFHLARADFILRNAAWLAGTGIDHRGRTGLQLPRTPCCHKDVPVVAVKAFDQLHWDVPLETELKSNQCRTSIQSVPQNSATFGLSRS